jgi:hypothetical protein
MAGLMVIENDSCMALPDLLCKDVSRGFLVSGTEVGL